MAEEQKDKVKLSTVYLSGQAMFTELGYALQFNGKYGWHMLVKGGYVEIDIIKDDLLIKNKEKK
jgi:hypothetical protein